MRKIIQVTTGQLPAVPQGHGGQTGYHLYALCDDGSLWMWDESLDSMWRPLASEPMTQTEWDQRANDADRRP